MRVLYIRWGHLKSLRAALQLDVMMGSECVLCGKVFYNRHYIPEILRLQGPLFIVFRFEMTWSAIRSIQISKHSFVRTTQDESYCTSYSVEQSIFNLAYKCFAGMKDRATLRSDLSAVSGLRGVICESLLFSYNATSYDYFPETKAINRGGQQAEVPLNCFPALHVVADICLP